MPRKKNPEHQQVNVRLYKEDVEYLQALAKQELTSYQALLRELLHKAVQERKRKRIVR